MVRGREPRGLRKIAVFCDEMHFHLSLTKRTASNVGKRSRPLACSCGQQEDVGAGDRCTSSWSMGTYRVTIRTIVLLPSVGPSVQDVVSFFAAGSKVESLFKIARQAGVARIRARLPTVLR